MSLTITIERTESGLFRAEVAGHPRLVMEHADLPVLVEEIKETLDLIAVAPDGKLLLVDTETADEAAARSAVEKTALRNDDLDRLADRYPVPTEWGEEPGWQDAL